MSADGWGWPCQTKKNAAKLPSVISMLEKKSCKVQVASRLRSYPWKLAYTISDTKGRPSFFNLDAIDPLWKVSINDVKPHGLRSTDGSCFRVTESIWLVTQVGQRVSDTRILFLKNIAVEILLGTAFIDASIKLISLGKQIVYPINSSFVSINRTVDKYRPVAWENDLAEHSVCCSVAEVVKISAMLQVPVLVPSPATKLHVEKTPTHLMRQRPAMAAKGLCDETTNHLFTVLVAVWSKIALMQPKNMIIAQFTAPPDVLWFMPVHYDSVDMIQLYMSPETEHQKLERHYAAVKQNANELKKHWTEQVQLNDKYSHWKPSFLKMMNTFQFMRGWSIRKYCSGKVSHHSDSTGCYHSSYSPYWAGPRHCFFEKEEVYKMVEAGVAEPAASKRLLTIFFAPKKNGFLRSCVAYRRPNAVTRRDNYQSSRMDKYIGSLGEVQVFATLNANSGYR